jgi:hypothetical protein
MQDYPKHIKRLIREWNAEAHERELRRELTRLDRSFAEWRGGTISSGELAHRIHEWDRGPAHGLDEQYNSRMIDMNVAYAIVVGILSQDEVPPELVQALERPLAFYRDLKERDELRYPEA